jgi:hypothetical protein
MATLPSLCILAVPWSGMRLVLTSPVHAPRSSPTMEKNGLPAGVVSNTSTFGNGLGVRQTAANACTGKSSITVVKVKTLRVFMVSLPLESLSSLCVATVSTTRCRSPAGQRVLVRILAPRNKSLSVENRKAAVGQMAPETRAGGREHRAGLIGIRRISCRVERPNPIAVSDSLEQTDIGIGRDVGPRGGDLDEFAVNGGSSLDSEPVFVCRVVHPGEVELKCMPGLGPGERG